MIEAIAGVAVALLLGCFFSFVIVGCAILNEVIATKIRNAYKTPGEKRLR